MQDIVSGGRRHFQRMFVYKGFWISHQGKNQATLCVCACARLCVCMHMRTPVCLCVCVCERCSQRRVGQPDNECIDLVQQRGKGQTSVLMLSISPLHYFWLLLIVAVAALWTILPAHHFHFFHFYSPIYYFPPVRLN